jgi:hypothetical protein
MAETEEGIESKGKLDLAAEGDSEGEGDGSDGC